MSRTMKLTADPARISMAAAIRRAAWVAPCLVLTGRALLDLAAELGGGQDGAARFLVGLAGTVGRPIGVNLPAADGSSRTAFLAPRSWTEERLAGWIAGHHAELEAEFGVVARVGSVCPAPGAGA